MKTFKIVQIEKNVADEKVTLSTFKASCVTIYAHPAAEGALSFPLIGMCTFIQTSKNKFL